jgi:LemA protein
MSTLLIVVIIVVLLALWIFSLYNRFITIKTQIDASIQEIGNQLKRQADLIPNLVASVKGYMKHEDEIFKEITDARKGALNAIDKNGNNPQALVDASSKLEQALSPIMALFESTPALQAAGPTQKLMDELRDTADKVMYSRRTLIDITAEYNIMVATIPSNIIANMFGFTKQPGLSMPDMSDATTVSTEETKSPKVEL